MLWAFVDDGFHRIFVVNAFVKAEKPPRHPCLILSQEGRVAAFDLFRKRLQQEYPHVRYGGMQKTYMGALRMLVARLGWCRVEDQLNSIVARGKRGYIEMVMGADHICGPNTEFLDKEWAFIEKKARDFRNII